MRRFNSGATRDTEGEKYDYDGFLSPLVLHSYAKYLNKHRKQSDGNLRASDNWQQGIPLDTYMKSIWRHQMDVWAIHRGYLVYKERTENGEITHILPNQSANKNPCWVRVTLEDALGGLAFNTMGYWHELIKLQNTYIVPGECAENKIDYGASITIEADNKKDRENIASIIQTTNWEHIADFLEEFREK